MHISMMVAFDVLFRAFGGILPKYEDRFALFAFLWSIFVAGRRIPNENWEDSAINACNIIRFISILLFHRHPLNWIILFTTSSIFSFVIQKKEFVGIALSGILHAVLYFLLLGLSPLTYWNFGKHFFNLLVWPDDPRQLVLEIGMAFAIGLMTIHMLINLVEKILRVVRIDWFLVVAIIHPATLIYLFPTKYTLHVFGVWFSAILISIKYEKRWLVATLGIVFVFLYANML